MPADVNPGIHQPHVIDFLRTRRSRPSKTLSTPVPDRATLEDLLVMAARSPDHGKLEPWRFIVLERPALVRLAAQLPDRAAALGLAADQLPKTQAQWSGANLAVAVVSCPKPSPKIPEIEQIYSAGAVCLSLVNAALASGWGANWLSGWPSHDRTFVEQGLGLTAAETIAGIIHIGTATTLPPERPRPDVPAITTWMSE